MGYNLYVYFHFYFTLCSAPGQALHSTCPSNTISVHLYPCLGPLFHILSTPGRVAIPFSQTNSRDFKGIFKQFSRVFQQGGGGGGQRGNLIQGGGGGQGFSRVLKGNGHPARLSPSLVRRLSILQCRIVGIVHVLFLTTHPNINPSKWKDIQSTLNIGQQTCKITLINKMKATYLSSSLYTGGPLCFLISSSE